MTSPPFWVDRVSRVDEEVFRREKDSPTTPSVPEASRALVWLSAQSHSYETAGDGVYCRDYRLQR